MDRQISLYRTGNLWGIETKGWPRQKRPDNNNGWRCANFHCSVPGVLSPLGARCFSIRVRGVHFANCFCLLIPRHLASAYYRPKLCTACEWVQKTQLCIQQLKSGLHYNSYVAELRPSCLGGANFSGCPRPWPEVEHFPGILYFQIWS